MAYLPAGVGLSVTILLTFKIFYIFYLAEFSITFYPWYDNKSLPYLKTVIYIEIETYC